MSKIKRQSEGTVDISKLTFKTLNETQRRLLKFENELFMKDGEFNHSLEGKSGRGYKKICEWTLHFLNSDRTFFLYDPDTFDLYGACFIHFKVLSRENKRFIICYVTNRCTYNSTENKNFSSGKLLWAYILNRCYLIKREFMRIRLESGQAHDSVPFIVFNISVNYVVGYHLKMGMKPFTNSEVSRYLTKSDISEVLNLFGEEVEKDYLNSRELTVKGLLKNEKDSYLFYVEDYTVNYRDINSIVDSVNKNISNINLLKNEGETTRSVVRERSRNREERPERYSSRRNSNNQRAQRRNLNNRRAERHNTRKKSRSRSRSR
jgi:hypothetical protein